MIGYFIALSILNSILCIGLGAFTLSRKPGHPANISFALGMLGLAVNEAGSAAVLFSSNTETALLGMRVSLAGQAILSVTWLFFSIVFARLNYKEILSRWAFVVLGAGIASIFFVAHLGSPEFVSLPPSAADMQTMRWDNILESNAPIFFIGSVGRYFYIYLLLIMVFSLAQMENTLRSSSGAKRWQIKYVIFSTGAILAFFIYLASQKLLISTINVLNIPLTSSVIIISTTIMALFIIKNRLFDTDIFISRYIIYNSVTIMVAGIYLILVGIISYGIRYLNIPFPYFLITLFVFVSVLALVIILFTSTLRRRVQLLINRHFYKHKYEFRDKWMETTERLSSKMTIEEIQSTLIDMISETMGAKTLHLYLYDTISGSYSTASSGLAPEFKKIKKSHILITHIKTYTQPFLLKELKDRITKPQQSAALDALIGATGAVLCAPLSANQDIIGFILQGEDQSGEPYRQDDFEILKAMTTQAAVQIKNIKLTKELMDEKEMETFHRMSTFIMHDLKNLTNSLFLLNQNAKINIGNPEFQQDAIKTIENTITRMKGLIERLLPASGDIEIKKEQVDMKSLVGSAIKKIPLIENKNVIIITTDMEHIAVPLLNIDTDAMEMVFLNLLTNAYESIKEKGKITVSAFINEDSVELKISDNGVGMSKEFIETSLFKPFKTTKKQGFGIGLFQCKSIIEAHGGNIDIESEEGKGTIFTVRLPID